MLETLASCELFRGLGSQQMEAIVDISAVKSYVAGETVFRQGDVCPGLFVVKQGLVRVFRRGSAGQQHVLHLCGPSQSFAEVAVFAGFDLPAGAIAVQPTQCVMIPADGLRRQLTQDHQVCLQLLSGMALWTRHFVQMLDDIVLRDATQRVARVLCDAPTDEAGQINLTGSKKDIANHLNLASETFSRVLKRLKEDGIVHADANRSIRVVDVNRLAELVGQFNQ